MHTRALVTSAMLYVGALVFISRGWVQNIRAFVYRGVGKD